MFTIASCDIFRDNTKVTEKPIIFIINPGLDIDDNGYYHFTLDQTKWQTIHRVSGTTLYKEGTPAEFVKVYWESNLFWYLGDTLGYIIHEGLTDDLVYVSYDTTYITGFSGMEVPTSNQVSYSNSDGEVNNSSFAHHKPMLIIYIINSPVLQGWDRNVERWLGRLRPSPSR